MLDPKDLAEVPYPEPDAPVDEPVPTSEGEDAPRTPDDDTVALVIGDWVFRQKLGIPHLVESIVAGDIVTKCGRRLKDEPNGDGPLLLAVLEAGFSSRNCEVCRR